MLVIAMGVYLLTFANTLPLFLASNTSRMMTGQALVIDGGVAVTG